MKTLLKLSCLALLTLPSLTNAQSPESQPTEDAEVPGHSVHTHATVQVTGLVCGFCASGVERTFSRVDGVEDLSVSLDDGTVEIDVVPGALTDDEITRLVEDAGYEVTGIEWSSPD